MSKQWGIKDFLQMRSRWGWVRLYSEWHWRRHQRRATGLAKKATDNHYARYLAAQKEVQK